MGLLVQDAWKPPGKLPVFLRSGAAVDQLIAGRAEKLQKPEVPLQGMVTLAAKTIVVLALAGALLAGCVSDQALPEDSALPTGGVGSTNGLASRGQCIQPDMASLNAPLVVGLSGNQLEVARKFAAALQDPLVQDEPVDVGRYKPAFKTQLGYVLVDENNRPEYRATDDGRFSTDYARGVLDRLGADGSAYHVWSEEEFGSSLYQVVGGERLFGTLFDWSAYDGQLTVGIEAAYQLPATVPSMANHEKRGIAEQAAACLMAAAGNTTKAGYVHQVTTQWGRMVINETIVEYMLVIYSAPPNENHCPESGFSIMVDSVTRRAIGFGALPCA